MNTAVDWSNTRIQWPQFDPEAIDPVAEKQARKDAEEDAIGEYMDTGWLPDGQDTSAVLAALSEKEQGQLACELLRHYRHANREKVADIGMQLGGMLDDIVKRLVRKGLEVES